MATGLPPSSRPVTVSDLEKVEGKAELIGGRIVALGPKGRKPNRVVSRIVRSLDGPWWGRTSPPDVVRVARSCSFRSMPARRREVR